MRRFIFALAALIGAVAITAGSGFAADNDSNYLPSETLTPGATSKVDVEKLCAPGYSAPELSQKTADLAFENYGMARNHGDHVIDMLVPASLGGSNEIDNLWPQATKGDFGADKKDQLEAKLHEMVCAKQIKLGDAQKEIRKNWVKAYRQYVEGQK